MQLAGNPSDILAPAIRQRERLQDVLSSLSDEQWAHQSRCHAWTSQDVVTHLNGVNGFWTMSVQAGAKGNPTTLLADFDPVATPAQMVSSANESYAETLATFTAISDQLTELLSSLDDADWLARAEAPPGHLSVSAVIHHALWDSWVHERDILLPLGIDPVEEPDEVAASLRYVCLVSPAIAPAGSEGPQTATLGVSVNHPKVQFIVQANGTGVVSEAPLSGGDQEAPFVLTGDAVPLLEALSLRGPLKQSVPPSHDWMFQGLRNAFDVE